MGAQRGADPLFGRAPGGRKVTTEAVVPGQASAPYDPTMGTAFSYAHSKATGGRMPAASPSSKALALR